MVDEANCEQTDMHLHFIDDCELSQRVYKTLFSQNKDIEVTPSGSLDSFRSVQSQSSRMHCVFLDINRPDSTSPEEDLRQIMSTCDAAIVVLASQKALDEDNIIARVADLPVLVREFVTTESLLNACQAARQRTWQLRPEAPAADHDHAATSTSAAAPRRLVDTIMAALDEDASALAHMIVSDGQSDLDWEADIRRLLVNVFGPDAAKPMTTEAVEGRRIFGHVRDAIVSAADRRDISLSWDIEPTTIRLPVGGYDPEIALQLLAQAAFMSMAQESRCCISLTPDVHLGECELAFTHFGGASRQGDQTHGLICLCLALRMLGVSTSQLEMHDAGFNLRIAGGEELAQYS